jgi:dethiobiotin synthetase
MPTIVIAGTDTDVGKTVLSSLIMASREEFCYWKPIQSGLRTETDSQVVKRQSACSDERILPEAYRLTEPLSPHLSAQIDGVRIEERSLIPPVAENLIIETAGGVLVPINDTTLQIDILEKWGYPVVIASRTALGTINHTLLTIEALRRRSIPILGCVMMGSINENTEQAISHYGSVEILGRIPPLEVITPDSLRNIYREHFSRFDSVLPQA